MNTDKKDEALSVYDTLKLALEALEVYWAKAEHLRTKEDEGKAEAAITAIREALASKSEALASEASEQPAPVAEPHKQQEPVAMHEDWYDSNSCGHCGMGGGHASTCRHYKPTSPPANANTGKLWVALTSHPAFQQPESRITFHPGDSMKEVMRIDRYGVKVNPEYTVDEATQHVLNALSAHIQHTIKHAVAAEREACAKVCVQQEDYGPLCETSWDCYVAIMARGNT